jgi:hypothetical protein
MQSYIRCKSDFRFCSVTFALNFFLYAPDIHCFYLWSIVCRMHRGPVQSKLTDEGTQMLMTLVGKYYALKNALVATKATMTDSAATQMVIMADNFRSFIIKDTVNYAALKPFVDTILNQSVLISRSKDETCEKQRLAFGGLSSAMYGLLRQVELKNGGVYHEYCPMAFNDKGATWLSDESDIKNPYFGKKMLECGEVTDSL